MLEDVHIMVTHEPDDGGVSLTSPQLPGFVAFYDSTDELMRSYKTDLRSAGVRNSQVIGHNQARGQTPEGIEFVIRRQDNVGGNVEEREEIFHRMFHLLTASGPESIEFIADVEPSATGEIVVVACLATDTVGWLMDQLSPRGDVLVAAISVAGEMVATTQIASGDNAHLGWPNLEELGWTREMTLGEMMMREGSRSEPQLVSLRA